MATDSAGPVTIDRAYFETLLRRANFNNDDFAAGSALFANTQNLTVVSKPEYEGLLRVARQYANLRANLINGGVTQEKIALLSQDDASQQLSSIQAFSFPGCKREDHEDGGVRLNPEAQPYPTWNSGARQRSFPFNGNGNGVNGGGVGLKSFADQQEWADGDGGGGNDYSTSYSVDGHMPEGRQNPTFVYTGKNEAADRPYYARMCKRTIVLAGLADGTTHEDVTKVIRGGLILEVYLRAAEHSALVSFLREEDAVRFYEHVRKNDLYINHKRVFIKWADRHFHLAGHVAGKVALGATRNMIIRRCDPNHTEETIRDDLEHIHNLVVIDVSFIGGSCYIKTNSVHNSMFARTCMMSRAKYKGSKIEWDTDECAQPIEVIQKPSLPKAQHAPTTKKPVINIRNRFATLRLDDDDDESDDKFDTSSEFPAASTVNVTA